MSWLSDAFGPDEKNVAARQRASASKVASRQAAGSASNNFATAAGNALNTLAVEGGQLAAGYLGVTGVGVGAAGTDTSSSSSTASDWGVWVEDNALPLGLGAAALIFVLKR